MFPNEALCFMEYARQKTCKVCIEILRGLKHKHKKNKPFPLQILKYFIHFTDLALYSLPVALLRLRDTLSLQLLENPPARWQRAVDITQKSLRVGVTVPDKAVIQLLQLIRKTYFSGTKETCFIQAHNGAVLLVSVNCVYCAGWGMLTGYSC